MIENKIINNVIIYVRLNNIKSIQNIVKNVNA